PAVQPGDRVLVWKVLPSADPGDLVVVDTTATAPVDRSTPVSEGTVGRMLAAAADLLGVDTGRQDRLGVVGSATDDEVLLDAPVPGPVPRADVVGTVVLRVWPLDRIGTVSAAP
ncbi:MAG TPA: S24/S26 family peptidase, partial [Ornithinibacter sp.]|nr:S24/S26 family peptidase [Ornithinibacter sp.]